MYGAECARVCSAFGRAAKKMWSSKGPIAEVRLTVNQLGSTMHGSGSIKATKKSHNLLMAIYTIKFFFMY